MTATELAAEGARDERERVSAEQHERLSCLDPRFPRQPAAGGQEDDVEGSYDDVDEYDREDAE